MSRNYHIVICEECGEMFESTTKCAKLCKSCLRDANRMSLITRLPSERPTQCLCASLLFGASVADIDGFCEDYAINMRDYWYQTEGLVLNGYRISVRDYQILSKQLVGEFCS